MDAMLKGLPAYMLVGILIVIGVTQIHRIAGTMLGVIFWLLTAWFGLQAYEQGGAIGLPGLRFSRPIFLALCGFFVVTSILRLIAAFSSRRRKRTSEDNSSEKDRGESDISE